MENLKLNKQQKMSMKVLSVDDSLNIKNLEEAISNKSGDFTSGEIGGYSPDKTAEANLLKQDLSCWGYWQDHYYPQVIRESYPIYIRNEAEDKGRKAFEIIKMMKDKKIIKLDTVADFIEAMDALIKII